MTLQTIIQHLKNISNQPFCTPEEKGAIEKAIQLLETDKSKDRLLNAAKVLADLLITGIKILDP
jgi:hypothetical protein